MDLLRIVFNICVITGIRNREKQFYKLYINKINTNSVGFKFKYGSIDFIKRYITENYLGERLDESDSLKV